MAKPEAVIVSEVCSLCGVDWKLHGKNPTAETCVKLLLDEVSSLNARLAHRPFNQPYYYPQYWSTPLWYTTTTFSGNLKLQGTSGANYTMSSTSAPAPAAIPVKSAA